MKLVQDYFLASTRMTLWHQVNISMSRQNMPQKSSMLILGSNRPLMALPLFSLSHCSLSTSVALAMTDVIASCPLGISPYWLPGR